MTTRTFLFAVGSPIALLAVFVGLQHPALFLYYLGLGLLAVGIGGYAAAHVFRGERDELLAGMRPAIEKEFRTSLRLRDARIAELDAENTRLHLALTEAQIAAGTVRVPLLRVAPKPEIPPQRDGSEYEWPRIARVLDIEAGESQ